MDAHIFNVNVDWKEGRTGEMTSPELTTALELATPPQFPSGVEGIWSPEHLFTASVASCLMTTFLAIAENSKLEFKDFKCKSSGKLDRIDGKFLMTEVILEPTVTVLNEADKEKAERVLQKSETNCLISNSVNSKITMIPTIVVG